MILYEIWILVLLFGFWLLPWEIVIMTVSIIILLDLL